MNSDIFTKNEYINYINLLYDKNEINNFKKKILLYYYKNKNKIKCDYNSNNQFSILLKNIRFNNEQIARLELLLNNFTNYKTTKYILYKMYNNKDNEIIDIISKNEKTINIPICNKWRFAIELICSKIKKNKKIIYLDIGCGDARKTKLFHQYLNLPEKNTFCTDINSWGLYSENKTTIPFQFELIKNNKLNYDDINLI